MPSEFQIYQDARGAWRWRLRAENSKNIAAASEGYVARAGAMNGIDVLREWRASPTVYEDNAGPWRWRLVHANGNVIATSGEGYVAKSDCEHGLELTHQLAKDAPLHEA